MRLVRTTAPLAASLVLLACVAKDPDSLGSVEESGHDSDPSVGGTSMGGTSMGGTSMGGTSMGGTSVGGTSSGGSDTGEPACIDPALSYEPATCPDELATQLPAPGCYEPCEGPGDPCGVGVCTDVQINPCACPPNADGCCEACAASEWLCVEGLVADVCDEIVGTFVSIEDQECGISKMGPVLCPWSVELFETGDFLWMYSDFGESGTYTCEDGVLTITSGSMFEASYNPGTHLLTWDGLDYQPVGP